MVRQNQTANMAFLGIKDKIKNKIWKKHPELVAVGLNTVHVEYKKNKKVYEIFVGYGASEH